MRSLKKNSLVILLLLPVSIFANPNSNETLLLRTPTLSDNHIAFAYAGDIWISNQDGGQARRLTINPGDESEPIFSPDGQWIAFSGNYDGNLDVFVVSVEGGQPQRLTFHPDYDVVRGWTPDSEKVLFISRRYSNSRRTSQLYTVSKDGGFPEALPMPMAERGSFSQDGKRIAYTPIRDAFRTWKRYRGGQFSPIWLFDLKTHEVEEIPHERANNTRPLWVEDTVYFLSDRNHTMNIFVYDTKTKQVNQITHHKDFDVKSLTVKGDLLVYEQGGRLHQYSPTNGKNGALKIQIAPDLPSARPHYEKAAEFIQNAGLSPSGVRALFEARGEIFTVPAEKGNIRNITKTPGINDRFPAWSPDGKWIAYLSDASGEYQLLLRDQKGLEEPRRISLGDPTFYYSPKWSPDSKKIVYTDKRLNLYYLDMDEKKPVLVDSDTYDHPQRSLDPAWAPDSKWLAYAKRLDNHLRAVFFYELASRKKYQITDGMSDAISVAWSKDGKYAFFAASTDYGLNTGWLDLSSIDHRIKRSLYVVVLNKKEASPFEPESDDEETEEKQDERKAKEKDDKKKGSEESEEKEERVEVVIDLENIDQRILVLPVAARTYHNLQTADEGKLFYLESVPDQQGATLHRFDMKERESKAFLTAVINYWVSDDGKKLLYSGQDKQYGIVDVGEEVKIGDGSLKLSGMQVYVDPRAEWQQMFHELWRIQRDYFYVPNMHGLDWMAIRKRYEPFLTHVGHRSDLNFLFAEMIGEMVVGHNYVGGGDYPDEERVPVGLLGADYEIVDGFYRIEKIYSGLNWNPDLRAPLTEPGIDVSEGDYILAVNGRPLRAPTNLFSLFENTAGKQTVITVNSRPAEEGARQITVVPIESEMGLRNRSWVEGNRQKVNEMTDGRVAYVYLPNTAQAGYTYFNRYYFSQLDKEAVIVDERFNGGGYVADYVIDLLDRPVLSYWATREGKEFTSPNASIFGPKVMIINQYAGSGGDALPLFFRRRGLGKLVGKRTWGGLVGIYDYPPLMDGGFVTSPRLAIFSPDGQWEVENIGVPPDIEVEMTPKLVIAGHDPQLEKAIEVILQELQRNPVKRASRPKDPVRVN